MTQAIFAASEEWSKRYWLKCEAILEVRRAEVFGVLVQRFKATGKIDSEVRDRALSRVMDKTAFERMFTNCQLSFKKSDDAWLAKRHVSMHKLAQCHIRRLALLAQTDMSDLGLEDKSVIDYCFN